jgi:hypothetical protein
MELRIHCRARKGPLCSYVLPYSNAISYHARNWAVIQYEMGFKSKRVYGRFIANSFVSCFLEAFAFPTPFHVVVTTVRLVEYMIQYFRVCWIWGYHTHDYEAFDLLHVTLYIPVNANRCFGGTRL